MPGPTIADVTKMFLYGSTTMPGLESEAVIRPDGPGATPLSVDVQLYMSDGGGRFALGPESDLIRGFFTSTGLAEGTYNKTELRGILGELDNFITIRQSDVDDGGGDYADRSYIFNTGRFWLPNDAVFAVDGAGHKSILNYRIVPYEDDNLISRAAVC